MSSPCNFNYSGCNSFEKGISKKLISSCFQYRPPPPPSPLRTPTSNPQKLRKGTAFGSGSGKNCFQIIRHGPHLPLALVWIQKSHLGDQQVFGLGDIFFWRFLLIHWGSASNFPSQPDFLACSSATLGFRREGLASKGQGRW